MTNYINSRGERTCQPLFQLHFGNLSTLLVECLIILGAAGFMSHAPWLPPLNQRCPTSLNYLVCALSAGQSSTQARYLSNTRQRMELQSALPTAFPAEPSSILIRSHHISKNK